LNRKNPYIVLQFLIFKSNLHQITQIKKLSKELRVDQLLLKTAQVYNLSKTSDFIPDNSDYSRYNKTNAGFKLKNKLQNKCWRMWSSSVITWDGKVVPCCFDKDAEYKLGDLTKISFSEIWNNKYQLSFRKQILTSRKNINICINCTNGSNIWVN
jgi:radical SAM protein with 4Fe4S-binding SPASM domain